MARSHMCVRDLTVMFSRVGVHVSLIQRRCLFTTKRMTTTTTEDICATLKKKKISNSCVTRLRSHRLHFTVGSTEK